jgi:hypothetical protein
VTAIREMRPGLDRRDLPELSAPLVDRHSHRFSHRMI